jgi:para-nitrobenzyl esterase
VRAADNKGTAAHRLVVILLMVVAVSACTGGKTSAPVTVTSASGSWTGSISGGAAAFKGIPYAAPVDGERRWLAPLPAAALAGGFPAKEFGQPCFHLNELIPDKRKPSDFVGDGDCLNLNVWVPESVFAGRESAKSPVMVFIHGGAFEIGFSGWEPGGIRLYDGARLAQAGQLLVVTINYRVGAFGFLRHPVLNAAAGGSANPGILDQIEALRWVQKYISAFGGDPANVTVFGESAGGISICNLLTVPAAKGLFHKAIIESGSCMLQSAGRADSAAQKILTKLGCLENKTPEQQAECMRSKDAKEVVLAQPKSTTMFRGELSHLPIAPVLDGVTFNAAPDEVIRNGQHHQVPVLIGSNAREIPAWFQVESKDGWEGAVGALAAESSPETAAAVRRIYEERNRGNYRDLIAELKSDLAFTCRIRYFADLIARHQTQPVYLYLFEKSLDVVESITDRVHGSFHGMELFYVFQHVPAFALPGLGGMLAAHQELQQKMAALWTGFAKSGALPPDDSWQDWQPYREKRMAGILGDFYGTLDDPRREKCELLEKHLTAGGPVGVLR